MAQSKSSKPRQHQDKVPTEPGFEKRLANMYKKALNTPPARQAAKASRKPKK